MTVSRSDVEAQASRMFYATPVKKRRLASPPTLPEMLVGGSEAQAQLARMFVEQQPPHVIRPTKFRRVLPPAAGGGGHRRVQQQESGLDEIAVTVVTTAPDDVTAQQATSALAISLGGTVTPHEPKAG